MCIYCDYCVYHYKSTELVSLYTLDIGLKINIIIPPEYTGNCESTGSELSYILLIMRIPAHLRCTQCSILSHLINICFLPCICLWQISQIQTCFRAVVGPGLVLTTSAFMRTSAPRGRLTIKNGSGPHCLGREVSTQFAHRLARPL